MVKNAERRLVSVRQTRPRMANKMAKLKTCVSALVLGVFVNGCDDAAQRAAAHPNRIRVGYVGLTCEAPIFSAVEKGFFKEEGLDVELVRWQWATYKDALAR